MIRLSSFLESLSLIVSRLSYSFLPLHNPSTSFKRPRSSTNIFKGTSVIPGFVLLQQSFGFPFLSKVVYVHEVPHD